MQATPGSFVQLCSLASAFALVLSQALVLVAPAPASAQSGPVSSESEERIEQLSEAELKDFYVGCSRAALRGLLGSSHAALCSVGYEILLKRHFGDDFDAFLAWSRGQGPDAPTLADSGAPEAASR